VKQNIKVVVFLIIILAVASFFYFRQNKTVFESLLTPSPKSVVSESSSELLQGGSSYGDPNGIYSFLYPNGYAIDSQDSLQVRVYKNGPTQKGQTEMYDGVIVNFGKVNLDGKSLNEWVNDSIKQATADGTSEVIEAKTSITFNKYPGFSYTLRGLGTSEYIVVQKDSNSDNAIVITYLVADPTNVGFQKQVDDILSTLQILK
jgi:hypothetical protein